MLIPLGSRSASFRIWLFSSAFLACLSFQTPAAAQQAPDSPGEAVLKVWNREIVVLRAVRGGRTPEVRAQRAARVLRSLPVEALAKGVAVERIETEAGSAALFEVGDELVFALLEGDVDPESGDTLATLARRTETRLRGALDAHLEQSSLRRLVRAAIIALIATLVYAGLIWGLLHGRRFARSRLLLASRRSLGRALLAGFDLWSIVLRVIRWLVNAFAWAIGIAATYGWLTFVLFEFPYTRPWGEALGGWLMELLVTMLGAAVDAVPGLVVALVILLIANGLTSLVAQLFDGVAAGRIQLSWVRTETADATRRITTTLIWVFALALAYPYIPGSASTAFQGISVLLGVMISLGSASLVNHAMSGLVVVYSRAFRAGDFVRVGETEGVVTELGALSSKILTPAGEVTIPHGVVVSGPTMNWTRPVRGKGSLISITVTIGYDAPWRQVHALLIEAAADTSGLCDTPPPQVLQRELSDFYVQYQLIAHVQSPERTFDVLSALNQNVQDRFNEHGVQILSPHFMVQPPAPAVVPRERWFTAPAEPEV